MKRFLQLFLLSAVVAAPAATPDDARARSVNGVVAIVDKEVITWGDLDLAMRPFLPTLQANSGNREAFTKNYNELQKQVIDDLVDRLVILHDFKTKGYNLPESFIEDQVQRDIRETYGSRTKLINTLHEEGETYETYRQRIRERVILYQLTAQNVRNHNVISPKKITDYYQEHQDQYKLGDQVKVRVLWLLYGTERQPRSLGDAKKLAEEIQTKLKEGTSFGEMATIYSDIRTESTWYDRPGLIEDLRQVAFTTPVGKVSGVIESGNALCLVMVEEAKPAHVRPLNELRDEIEKTLLNQEQERLRKQWIKGLREKSFVRYF